MINTLVMILAGGKGERLSPLTRDRAKPAVPFGGRYRIIDFALSNLINSGFFRIKVLTQFRSNSLLIHLARGFNFGSMSENYVDAVPAQQGVGDLDWYAGTADAIYQNISIVHDEDPQDVAVFGGDHIYKMDVRQMLNYHRKKQAACTVATVPYDRREAAGQFGILEVDSDWRIVGFEEKPDDPKPIPGQPDKALVSMGNYIFNREALVQALEQDHQTVASEHDFGKNVIPSMMGKFPVFAYNFLDNDVPGEEEGERGYWRDVGTLEAYFEANLDLCRITPQLNLYNYAWPIRTASLQFPPAKFAFDSDGRRGMAVDSVVSDGTILSGGQVRRSIVFNNVFVHSYALIEDAILLPGCNIGRGARLKRVICDKDVTIEDGTVIGEDRKKDEQRFHVSPSGIVVVSKGSVVPCEGEVRQLSVHPPPGTLRPRIHEPGCVVVTAE